MRQQAGETVDYPVFTSASTRYEKSKKEKEKEELASNGTSAICGILGRKLADGNENGNGSVQVQYRTSGIGNDSIQTQPSPAQADCCCIGSRMAPQSSAVLRLGASAWAALHSRLRLGRGRGRSSELLENLTRKAQSGGEDKWRRLNWDTRK